MSRNVLHFKQMNDEFTIFDYVKNTIGLDEFLSVEEMKRRQMLGFRYFQGGRIYRVRKDFSALSMILNHTGRPTKVETRRGDYLLCVKSQPYKNEIDTQPSTVEIGEVEFIYNECMLRYVSDCHTLCCMLDLVEVEHESLECT